MMQGECSKIRGRPLLIQAVYCKLACMRGERGLPLRMRRRGRMFGSSVVGVSVLDLVTRKLRLQSVRKAEVLWASRSEALMCF
jgi:hypothetical protein